MNPLLRNTTLRGVAFAAVLMTVVAGWMYNRYVVSAELVEAAWRQVRIVEQRRMDLIPSLVEVARAHAAHERRTLDALSMSRAAFLDDADAAAGMMQLARLDTTLAVVLALPERYPSLGSAELYRTVAFELRGAVNRIAVERMRYNEAAARHRTLLRRFPYRMLRESVPDAPAPGVKADSGH